MKAGEGGSGAVPPDLNDVVPSTQHHLSLSIFNSILQRVETLGSYTTLCRVLVMVSVEVEGVGRRAVCRRE